MRERVSIYFPLRMPVITKLSLVEVSAETLRLGLCPPGRAEPHRERSGERRGGGNSDATMLAVGARVEARFAGDVEVTCCVESAPH